jgi:hypothetical protein
MFQLRRVGVGATIFSRGIAATAGGLDGGRSGGYLESQVGTAGRRRVAFGAGLLLFASLRSLIKGDPNTRLPDRIPGQFCPFHAKVTLILFTNLGKRYTV